MYSYVNVFLKTELTCIPGLLNKYIGNYYNNALCNGATWIFFLWFFLHLGFDNFLYALLTKMRYKEYVRIRLKNSLWYLGFFVSAFGYSGATLFQNEVELFNFKKMHVPSETNLPAQLGYTLMVTFYLHSAVWEGLRNRAVVTMVCYLLLSIFLVTSYILRIVEISFTLSALVSLVQIVTELTRCSATLSKQEGLTVKIGLGALFVLSVLIYVAVYLFVIPLTYIVPLGLKILSDYPNGLLLILFLTLICWLTMELYNSTLFNLVNHWLYHNKDVDNKSCYRSIVDCSLFLPRDDDAFNLRILRQEIKAREAEMMSKRKPKNRSMLVQTLKCMVALKRKLSEKRLSESSDSDDSEKSEDSETKITREINEKGELESDEDSEFGENEDRDQNLGNPKITVEDIDYTSFENYISDECLKDDIEEGNKNDTSTESKEIKEVEGDTITKNTSIEEDAPKNEL